MTLAGILAAVAGGLMIGTAAGLLLLLSGRVAGVSGIAAKALYIADKGPPWVQAAAFVIGLLAGAIIVRALTGTLQIAVSSPRRCSLRAGCSSASCSAWA